MDNLYSKFYVGRQNPFGMGTWDSNMKRKLNHSISQPYLSQNSTHSKNLILPPVGSKYDNGAKKYKNYQTQSSSSTSSYRYDTFKNRKELSNYIKDINYNVANKLQNDNFIAQQKLNNLKNNYNEIKTLLNNKIEKLEHDQQMQFDNLKYALEQGGGLKMLGAVKNANGGRYDLRRAEEEDIIDAGRRLPRLIKSQLDEVYAKRPLRNLYRKDRIFSNMSSIQRRVDDELERQRSLDDMKFKRELDEIEAKRETMRQERKRMLRELQSQDIDDIDDPLFMPTPPLPPPPPYYPNPYNPYMAFPPPYFMPPMNNNNNHLDSTGDLIKIFLIKKLFDGDKQQQQQQPYQQYPYYPGMPPAYPPPYQQQPGSDNQKPQIFSYPPPIVVQNPPNQNPPREQLIKKDKEHITTESQKGIPFNDPLEKYLEMVNKTKDSSEKSDSKAIKLKKKKGGDDDEDNEEGEGGEGEEGEEGEGGEGEEGEGEEGEDGEGGEGDGEGEGEGEGEGDEGGDEGGEEE